MTAALLALACAAPQPDHHLQDEKPAATGIVARVTAAVGAEKLDKPFLLVVSMTAKQGRGQDLIDAYRGAARKSMAEPGCKSYALTRDAENPAKFLLYERWESVAALESHLEQPYTKSFVSKFGDLLEESGVAVMKPIAPGPKPDTAE